MQPDGRAYRPSEKESARRGPSRPFSLPLSPLSPSLLGTAPPRPSFMVNSWRLSPLRPSLPPPHSPHLDGSLPATAGFSVVTYEKPRRTPRIPGKARTGKPVGTVERDSARDGGSERASGLGQVEDEGGRGGGVDKAEVRAAALDRVWAQYLLARSVSRDLRRVAEEGGLSYFCTKTTLLSQRIIGV